MEVSEHTPYTRGPWVVVHLAPDSLPIVQDARERDVAWIRDGAESAVGLEFVYLRETVEANARLIKTAPELLETLVFVRDFIKGIDGLTIGSSFWAHLDAVIEKATV